MAFCFYKYIWLTAKQKNKGQVQILKPKRDGGRSSIVEEEG